MGIIGIAFWILLEGLVILYTIDVLLGVIDGLDVVELR
jgi:hypothetical protein